MRLYVMHAGMPMTDEMIALLYSHPQVFVDICADNVAVPRPEFFTFICGGSRMPGTANESCSEAIARHHGT
jgi:predicted TIM-barrel fold metal-dependent hydrolase